MRCASCGSWIRESAHFCEDCGAPTATGDPVPAPDRVAPPAHLAARIEAGRAGLEGERKQVTVLFADVVDSLAIAQRTDPEDWHRLMHQFLQLLAAGVHQFEGTVDKFTGDGIMAIFGAPLAHEDHARSACHAALYLQDELKTWAAEVRSAHGLDFDVRIGINSGEVVVGTIGEEGAMSYTAIGHTVGLAKRIEEVARPGQICISADTSALVTGYFALRHLGSFVIKGIDHEVPVHALEGLGEARGGLDVARSRGLTRFVGREGELGELERCLQQALEGRGQVIGIVGEPGVGKSRLCHELAERCRDQGMPTYHVAAQPHTRSVPLMPVLQHLRSYFEIGELDSEQAARDRITRRLRLLDDSFEGDLPLIFDFLAIPDPARPVERMDPEARQRRLLKFTGRLVRARSAQEPGLTLFEDLHWIDPASEAFLETYLEAVHGTRGLVLVNFRPTYQAPWMSRSYYRQIALTPLSETAVRELLIELLGTDPSLDGLLELIQARTAGNAFFIEEMVRALVEEAYLQGTPGAYRLARSVDEMKVPATVQAVLAARIDRLNAGERAVLQDAAVIGRQFHRRVLQRVTGLEEAELDDALHALVAAEYLREETRPDASYAFEHPLTQEVAYRSQLSERRAQVHAATAGAIAEHYQEQLDERAALVASHWELAGALLEAARWHARAAAWSGFNDPTEALRHWRRVVELSDDLPPSAERDALGLGARIATLHFGWRLGIGADKADALFRDAERMASDVQDARLHALLLAGYGAVKGLGQGVVEEYSELARRAIELAEHADDAELQVVLGTNGYAFFLTGDYREGLRVVDRAIELAADDPRMGGEMPVVACPYALCHAQKGALLTELGDLAGADRCLEAGRAIAREQGDLESLALAHLYSSWQALAAGDSETSLGQATNAVEVSEKIGDAISRAWAWSLLGAAEAARGNWHSAIEALEGSDRIATEHRAAQEGRAYRLAHLAEAELGLGRTERARGLAADALAVAEESGGPPILLPACLAWARVLLADTDSIDADRVESKLRQALGVVAATGARRYEPLLRVELAALAGRLGDEEQRERELREAHRLFGEIGADGHADRLAEQLAITAEKG
jgi:class 3 adenylate cyclase/tetratricopeptide (TPR) repeat protein